MSMRNAAAVAEYDYVIVGAGSAGCTLAYRLTEDPACRVLLIEAGGWDYDPLIHIPLGWGRILLQRKHDWMYFAEPEAAVNGRAVECARGRVVGGSSSINAMAYVRGNRADYARWASAGLTDWSFAKNLPYFKRQESWEQGNTEWRGGAGPLTTQNCRYADPLVQAYIEAGLEAGHPFTNDYNGASQDGFGAWQMTIRNGRRCSAAVAYLRPALKRPNLKLQMHALAHRVVIEGGAAKGIVYACRGTTTNVRVRREVILAGGVINSPQLLMLSGVGDAAALRARGIVPNVHAPGVGKNYQDHMSVALFYKRRQPGPLHPKMRLDRLVTELAKTYLFGTGVPNDLPAGTMAFLKTSAAEAIPDIQVLFNAAPLAARPYLAPFVAPYADGFAARVVGLRPESRGVVELASSDPRVAPLIKPNFFSGENDIVTLRKALRLARDVARQPALAPFVAGELAPGASATTDAEIDAYIRNTAITVHHPLGTCRMGADGDELAVVDQELRVRGVDSLRVVDASVMPDLVGGNINAAVIMIAEKAADLIRGKPLLASEDVELQRAS